VSSSRQQFFGLDFAGYPIGTSFLRRKDNWFLVGGDRAGRSHALTYVLETMGCRYLWPGDGGSGKIVPKKSEIVFPDFGDWTYTPAVKHRGIRTPIPNAKQFREGNGKSAAKHGQDADAFREEIIKYRNDFDLPGTNRDFYAWHGVSDRDSLDGDYAWGHYFKDYYDKYSAEHPEFFALHRAQEGQVDGIPGLQLLGNQRREALELPLVVIRRQLAPLQCLPDPVALSYVIQRVGKGLALVVGLRLLRAHAQGDGPGLVQGALVEIRLPLRHDRLYVRPKRRLSVHMPCPFPARTRAVPYSITNG
jgi:hypothetical protein